VGLLHLRYRQEFQTIGVIMKTCIKCKEEKPFSEFGRDRSRKDGHNPYCKICHNGRLREWRLKNKDHYKEYKKIQNKHNKQYYRSYYLKHKKKINLNHSNYYKKQPSAIYIIVNKKNGRIYVGETTMIGVRIADHKRHLRLKNHPNKSIQNDCNKHSLDVFDFQVIEEHPPDADKSLLVERERYFINKYKEEGKELYNAW